jgi:hypothetical protein
MVAHRFANMSRLPGAQTQPTKAPLQILSGLLLLLVTFLAAGAASAQESLEASVNQTSMHENETLTLTVKGRTELELSLGSLMNLQNLELPEPDLADLRESFDILDQRQAYSLRSVNGEHSAEVTWTYQLAPRQSGELTIPSLTFKGAQSQPIIVEVKPGRSPQTDSHNRPAWVEAEITKERAFVQEQLVYSLKLYYRGSLIGGDLTEPQLEDAIVEPLGDQRQSSEYIDGKRYNVVERRYLVYPQRSGTLTLPSQRFTGRQRDPVTGNLRFLRAQSEPLPVEILPPPSDFPGDQWIPAESLVLDEDWSRPPETVHVGDSLTRTLTLRTLGLLKSALPLLSVDYPEQFNAYPEGPQSEAEINSGTIEATQTQTTALVAVKPGKATLPEIRLHWWDTLNDQARVAVVPARTVTVLPAPGSDPAAESSSTAAPEPGAGDQAAESAPAPATTEPDGNPFNRWITTLAVFFALAWLVTLALWLRRRSTRPQRAPDQDTATKTDLAKLKRHAVEGRVETLQEIPAWVRETFNRADIHTLKDTRAFFNDPALNQALDELEQHHFGTGNGRATRWTQGEALAAALERLGKKGPRTGGDHKALPPFRKLPG